MQPKKEEVVQSGDALGCISREISIPKWRGLLGCVDNSDERTVTRFFLVKSVLSASATGPASDSVFASVAAIATTSATTFTSRAAKIGANGSLVC